MFWSALWVCFGEEVRYSDDNGAAVPFDNTSASFHNTTGEEKGACQVEFRILWNKSASINDAPTKCIRAFINAVCREFNPKKKRNPCSTPERVRNAFTRSCWIICVHIFGVISGSPQEEKKAFPPSSARQKWWKIAPWANKSEIWPLFGFTSICHTVSGYDYDDYCLFRWRRCETTGCCDLEKRWIDWKVGLSLWVSCVYSSR